jgi:hypothetical protein
MQNQIDDGRSLPVRELGRIAADRRSNDSEDAGADDGADAQRGE